MIGYALAESCLILLIMGSVILIFAEERLLIKSTKMPTPNEFIDVVHYLASLTYSLEKFENFAEMWKGLAIDLHFRGDRNFINLEMPEHFVSSPRARSTTKISTIATLKIQTETTTERGQNIGRSVNKQNSSNERKRTLKDMAISYTFECFCIAIKTVNCERNSFHLKVLFMSFLALVKRDWIRAREVIDDLSHICLSAIDKTILCSFE